jgi:hypothetical protein
LSPSLPGLAAPGVVRQDLAHQVRRDLEKMRRILKRWTRLIH